MAEETARALRPREGETAREWGAGRRVNWRAKKSPPWFFEPWRACLNSEMAEQKGLEPSASGVTGQRYNRLNYCSADVVGGTGLEPVTAGL